MVLSCEAVIKPYGFYVNVQIELTDWGCANTLDKIYIF